jgi:hypothetical protein
MIGHKLETLNLVSLINLASAKVSAFSTPYFSLLLFAYFTFVFFTVVISNFLMNLPSQPSLMFAGKAGAYPRVEHLEGASFHFTWVGSSLTRNH